MDMEKLARLGERLRSIERTIAEMGASARKAIAASDRYAVAEHPDLDTLGHELRNLYGGAFDSDA